MGAKFQRSGAIHTDFALHETGQESDVLEAHERLIHDAMSADHTLLTTAEGVEAAEGRMVL